MATFADVATKPLDDCTIISEGPPRVYALKTKKIPMKKDSKVRQFVIGSKVSHRLDPQLHKVMMAVGAKGAGKTVLINFLVNYIMGVEWGTNFRYHLVHEKDELKKQSQADSQTEWITSYTFYPQNGQKIPYTFTVIDTPGFGDTLGLDKHKEIIQQIREFFSTPSEHSIDQIDVVAFVAQSSLPRLTETQRCMFDSVLSLFGTDITENIFLFLTFADILQPPQILQAVDKVGLQYKRYFKFNSSALYAPKRNTQDKNDETDQNSIDTDEKDADCLNKHFWKMSERSSEMFFKELQASRSKPIMITSKDSERSMKEKEEVHVSYEYTMVCNNCEVTCHRFLPILPKCVCVLLQVWYTILGCSVCPENCGLSHHNINSEHTQEKLNLGQTTQTSYEALGVPK